MTTEEFTTQVIKAAEGKYLTEAYDVDIKERTIGTVVALGKGQSADNWKEISAKEADKLRAEKAEVIKAEMEAKEAEMEANKATN